MTKKKIIFGDIMCLSENSYFYELYGKEKREQGRAEMANKVIRNLLKEGVSVEEISELVEVPLDQVKSIYLDSL